MEARAKLFGHPIHQMLIVLPLGLLTGAVIFDLLRLFGMNDDFSAVAYWLILAGVIAGLIAAVFGFIDWLKIPVRTRAKRIGAQHGIGNVVVVVLFSLSWLLRGGPDDAPQTLALILSFSAGGLAMLTGWLGGELVGRLGVGVDDGAHLDAPSSLSGPATASTHTRR